LRKGKKLGNQELSEIRNHAQVYRALKQELLTLTSEVNTSTSALYPTIRGVLEDDLDWDATALYEFLDRRAETIHRAMDAIAGYRHVVEAGYLDDHRTMLVEMAKEFLNN
jgi:hypothetical protein